LQHAIPDAKVVAEPGKIEPDAPRPAGKP